ncbi:MAG TPA: flagellar basal body L-ring protein FlgH [Gammaproteobacteria bacterium]|nr:flagellar basal body L-ring protein FlgH [Gammaproteobacteria bacterium]
MKRLLSMLVTAVLLQACAGAPRQPDPVADDFGPVLPSGTFGEVAPGTVYNPAASFDLFMDLRARQVGDILTVLLVERTNATKESSTSTEKGTSVDTGIPVFAGKPITHNGNPLHSELDSSNSFDGKADSSQSNRLDGSITVTVAGRLPNGNLLVRGEKQITINQGQEYVRLQGIVRPVDIGPQNTVASTKVGDARITYSGKGALADANHPGWLSRFFNSPWFPF